MTCSVPTRDLSQAWLLLLIFTCQLSCKFHHPGGRAGPTKPISSVYLTWISYVLRCKGPTFVFCGLLLPRPNIFCRVIGVATIANHVYNFGGQFLSCVGTSFAMEYVSYWTPKKEKKKTHLLVVNLMDQDDTSLAQKIWIIEERGVLWDSLTLRLIFVSFCEIQST